MAIFDADAAVYDNWFETKMGAYADAVETGILLRLLNPQKGMRILDLGCGTGNIAFKLVRMGCEVTGIDVSAEMLRQAKAKAEQLNLAVEFIQQDVYAFDRENSFDGVCSNTALEFLPRKEAAIAAMLRAVKKGGNVAVGTINRESGWYDFYMEELRKDNSFFSIFQHAAFVSADEMRQLFPDKLLSVETGLFLPPTVDEQLIGIETDQRYQNEGMRGGYLCGLWRK
jgi:ubiquinone/menaquinone biosynthesis C-methylase UbiE